MSAGAPDVGAMMAAASAGVPHQIQVGGGAPPGPPPDPSQPGVPGALSPSQPGGADAFASALQQLLDDLHSIVGLADDPVDRDQLAKCLQVVNGIVASEQKEQDSAMGGKVSPRLMRKAYA